LIPELARSEAGVTNKLAPKVTDVGETYGFAHVCDIGAAISEEFLSRLDATPDDPRRNRSSGGLAKRRRQMAGRITDGRGHIAKTNLFAVMSLNISDDQFRCKH
jgi:hypothetical protein